jgi:hypothetical protein
MDTKEYYYVQWKNLCFLPKIKHDEFMGKYLNWDRVDDDKTEQALERHYIVNSEEAKVSYLSTIYLDSIINFCQIKDLYPILISTPLKDAYSSKIPASIKTAHSSIGKKYENQGVLFIDKSRGNYPDSLFLNADHLNDKGARRLEKELIQILRK